MDTKKIQAAVAVAVMLAAGAFVLAYAPDESDAAGTWDAAIDLDGMVLTAADASGSNGGVGYASFKVNETAFTTYTNATVTWTAYVLDDPTTTEPASGTTVYNSSTSTSEQTVNNLKLTMTASSNTGEYSLKVQSGSSAEDTYYLYLEYLVSFTLNGKTVDQSLVYRIDVTVTSSGIGTLTVTVTDASGNVGTNYRVTPTYEIDGTTLSSTGYTYYALNLPAGLSMNATTGAITGMPKEAGTSSVTIIVTDSNGNVYSNTDSKLSIVISESSSGSTTLGYVVSVDSTEVTQYVFETGTTVSVKVTINETTTYSGTLTVTVVNDDGEVETLTGTDSVFEFTSSGTGAYRVTMTYIDSTAGALSDSFYIYFYDDLADVEAKIVVSGS